MQNWIGLTNTAASNDDLVQFANVNYTGNSGADVVSGTRTYIQSNPYLRSGLNSQQAIVDMLTNNGLDQITTNAPAIDWTKSPEYTAAVFCNGGNLDGTGAVAGWVNGTADLATIYAGIRQAALTQAVGSTNPVASESQVDNYLFSTTNTYDSVVSTTFVTNINADTDGLIASKPIDYKTEVAMISSISGFQLTSVLATTKISAMGNNGLIFQQMLVDNSTGSVQPNGAETFSTDLYPIFKETNLVSSFLYGANTTGILNGNFVSSTYKLFKDVSTISDNQKIVLFAFDNPAQPVQLICRGRTANEDDGTAQLVVNRLLQFLVEFSYDQLLTLETFELVKSNSGVVTSTKQASPRTNNSSDNSTQYIYVAGAVNGTATSGSAVGIFNDSTNVGRLLSCLSGCPVNGLTVEYAKDTNTEIENLFASQNVKDAFAVLMNAQTLTTDYVFDSNNQSPFNRLMSIATLQGDYELIASIMTLTPDKTGPFIGAVVASWGAVSDFDALKLFNGETGSSMVLDYTQTSNTTNFVNQVFPLLVAPPGVTTMAFITAAADSQGATTRQQELMMIFNALLVDLVGPSGPVKEVRLALTQDGYDRLIANGGLSQFIIFEAIVETFIPLSGSINQVNKVEIFLAARDVLGKFIPAHVDPVSGIVSYPPL
jgi:hypothetical protein